MKPKRIKKNQYQFTVMVDTEKFRLAAKARQQTWAELVNAMLDSIIAGSEKKR